MGRQPPRQSPPRESAIYQTCALLPAWDEDDVALRSMCRRDGGSGSKCELSEPSRLGLLNPQQQTVCCAAVNSPFVPSSDASTCNNVGAFTRSPRPRVRAVKPER